MKQQRTLLLEWSSIDAVLLTITIQFFYIPGSTSSTYNPSDDPLR